MSTPNQEPSRRLVHRIQVVVRWGDMDVMGHVNNAVYFRYLETGRIAWFESIEATTRAQGQGPILVAAACNFRIPIVYPESIEVRTHARAPGRSSIPLYQEIWSLTQPEIMYANGDSTVAWVDFALNKSVPLPEAVRRLLPPSEARA